eukprot:m.151126 g.151126  ORF g.151126 m.151126 type:complete len:51 (-) comp16330_c0_seq2:1963-2115(-)
MLDGLFPTLQQGINQLQYTRANHNKIAEAREVVAGGLSVLPVTMAVSPTC